MPPKRRINTFAASARQSNDSKRRRPRTSSSMPAALFASSKLISAKAMAATRLQRVWRFQFRHALTKHLAATYLNPDTGVTIESVKNMG
jgi:hypothetical protein